MTRARLKCSIEISEISPEFVLRGAIRLEAAVAPTGMNSSPAWRMRASIFGFSKKVTLCPRSFSSCESAIKGFKCPVPVKDSTPKCHFLLSAGMLRLGVCRQAQWSGSQSHLIVAQHFFRPSEQINDRGAQPARRHVNRQRLETIPF